MPNFLRKRTRQVRSAQRLTVFWADRRGNLLPLFAIMLPMLLLMLGAAADYTSAARRQETIQGISDAAVLEATQPAMMSQSCYPSSAAPSNPTACAIVLNQVVNVFNAQAANVPGVTFTPITTSAVTITDSGNVRVASLNWVQQSNDLFSGILGMPTIAISGASEAKNGSPVTLFYMLIDETPSMSFPAYSSGVTTMVNSTADSTTYNGGTVWAGGCALGCHESVNQPSYNDASFNPSNVTCVAGSQWGAAVSFGCLATDNVTILPVGKTTFNGLSCAPTPTEGGVAAPAQTAGATTFKQYYGAEDNFALARCLGVALRIDLVNQAVSNLMTTANTMAVTNNTTYAVDIYALDLGDPKTAGASLFTASSTGVQPSEPALPSVSDVGIEPIYYWGCTGTTTAACTTGGGIDTPSEIVAQTPAEMSANFTNAEAVATNALTPLQTYKSCQTTSTSGCNGDNDSPIDLALESLYNGTYAMGTPGPGTPGSSAPNEVLFIVSDGMNDLNAIGGTAPTVTSATNPATSCVSATKLYTYFNRPLFCVNQTVDSSSNTYCADVKAKGIKIAFLYLRYNTLNGNVTTQPANGYFADIEPFQYPSNDTDKNNADFPGTYTDEVEQAAINCASTGLEFTVDTDGNIATAMTTLFQKAAQSVYLAH